MLTNCLNTVVADLCSIILRGGSTTPASARVDSTTAALEILLDEFHAERGGLTLVDAAAEAFRQLGEIPRILRWNTGLQDALHDLVLATVNEAERFGDGTGAFKRRFSVDVVTRVMRSYDSTGMIEPIEDVLIAPFVGIEIDWIVQALNIHNAWKPVEHVQLPRFFQGRYQGLLRFQSRLWRVWVRVRDLFFYPSLYERQIRQARIEIDPQVHALLTVLPPASQHETMELLANVIATIGNLTAPHVHTIDSLFQLVHQIGEMTDTERREVVFRAISILLRRTYADNDLAIVMLDSTIGQFVIRQLVLSTEWVLRKNSLLPGFGSVGR
jgi:hypothetical protein